MTARYSGAGRETKWEFPNHLSAAMAVVVDTLPKVLEDYDPLMFWRLEKEVTSRPSQTSEGNEVRFVTFELWPITTSIHSITLRLEGGTFKNPSPSGLVWTPIFMEIGPRATLKRSLWSNATLKRVFRIRDVLRGIIRVRFEVVEKVNWRTHAVHRELAIAEVQVL